MAEMADIEMLETSNNVLSALPSAGTTGWGGHNYGGMVRRHCIHSLDAYELDNGQTVYLSSIYDARIYRDWIPDIGFYLDGAWDGESESFTYLVPWTDYGLPLVTMDVFKRYIVTALAHIDNGETVDIGCLGGHGRTGTFIACLDIASTNGKMGAKRAISKVRTNHCWQAIETATQEWFVKAFRAFWNGTPIPKRPVTHKKKGNAKATTFETSPRDVNDLIDADVSDSDAAYDDGDYVYPTVTDIRYEEDYEWEFPDAKNKGNCTAYTNPLTGTRWLLDLDATVKRWQEDKTYVPTVKVTK